MAEKPDEKLCNMLVNPGALGRWVIRAEVSTDNLEHARDVIHELIRVAVMHWSAKLSLCIEFVEGERE